ncbi:hypothetical protein HYPSUDRAFT_198951 [Hypholoma sublateritium FD-334 SS-4]|uniref:DUF6533 domain-containing protein n=1 Tax=Hypholoma sublateritium (strain FD-334 SS-4) TaxID=945553 RepID=A0A0D2LGH3_HYPSF|nr:hypothetical protein HYPSUDRAFT_198951 [Hypholoma sublateritium FD-334 SS-4]
MAEVQESLILLNYASLSTITLMAYDCVLSFADEVTYVWNTAWCIPKVLYIISRYYPILHLAILYYVRNLTNASSQGSPLHQLCSTYKWYQGFGGVICILPPVTAIFTMRVCALYKTSRPVIILVWFLWTVETAGELATTIRVTIGEHDDIIGYEPGCLTITKSDPSLYRSELLAWVPALVGSCKPSSAN